MRVSQQCLQCLPEDIKFLAVPQTHIAHPGLVSISMMHLLCFLARVFLALSLLMPSTAEVEREGDHGGRVKEQKEEQDQTGCEVQELVCFLLLSASQFLESRGRASSMSPAAFCFCPRDRAVEKPGLLQRVMLKQGMGSGTCWLPLNCCIFDTFG